MKIAWTALITVVLCVDCMASNVSLDISDQQATEIDSQDARQLAIKFTTGFVRTTDLALLVKELFKKDFIGITR